MSRVEVRLDSVVDWSAFSRAVRALREEGVRPDEVSWRIAGEDDGAADLFESDDLVVRRAADLVSASPMPLPRSFVDAAREVFLHADPRRLPLIHRLAHRIADDARCWDDPLHEDRLQFERMQREVQREIHKMHAFVRFRRLDETVPVGLDVGGSGSSGGAESEGESEGEGEGEGEG